MTNTDTTAILFFSRTASEEAASKNFSPKLGLKGNRAISRCLIEDTLNTIKASGLPVISHFSPAQEGHGFGERLANAVESVYAKGFEQVIIVGNDCPFLSTPLLKEVSTQLQHQPLVLGPTSDGGVYLIGIQKGSYQRADFMNLNWQELGLQASWQTYSTKHHININWLEEYFDIDKATDLKRLFAALPKGVLLLRELLQILKSILSTFPITKICSPQKEVKQTLSLRGPPFVLQLDSFL
ncbi:MAG TPA: DUF2064 domain-containing protein [Saprospiraceae bacterium]|nr:DUF2064 domain-containing protein [Saprospiraceae bacterium]